jgi:hypothetical protein
LKLRDAGGVARGVHCLSLRESTSFRGAKDSHMGVG